VIDGDQTNVERVTANLYKLVMSFKWRPGWNAGIAETWALIKVSVNATNRSEVMRLVRYSVSGSWIGQ